MNERLTTPAAALRLVRVMKVAFIVSAILFLYVVIKIPATAPQSPAPSVEMAVFILAPTMIALGYVVPRALVKGPPPVSARASRATPVQRWFTANVIGFAIIETCSLFGVVLHVFGAELWRSELLIGAGIVATVFFSPGAPPMAEDVSSPKN